MAIDHSIYNMMQPVDFVGSYNKGLQMGDLARQRNEQKRLAQEDASVRESMKKNLVADASGNLTLDRKAYLSDLAKVNPEKAFAAQEKFTQQDTEHSKLQSEKTLKELDLVARASQMAIDQPSYDQALSFLSKSGVDVTSMPKQYDAQLVRRYEQQSMSAKERLEQQFKGRELDLREKDINAKYTELRDKRVQTAGEKQDKKKQMMFEIEDRRQNINAALDSLDSMIEKKGTWEMTGSHNQDLDRLIEQVATDMAKLQDPSSVARPSEVEAVKQSLIQPGFQNTNATARDILKNFRGEVERRADSAYKVRGLAMPEMQTAATDPRAKQQFDSLSDADLDRLYQQAGGR